MDDSRLPKQVFYSQLQQGYRSQNGFKSVKSDYVDIVTWKRTISKHWVSDRSSWRELCKDGIKNFELRRVDTVKEKRRLGCGKKVRRWQLVALHVTYVAILVPPESVYSRIDEYICDREICRVDGQSNNNISLQYVTAAWCDFALYKCTL